ncbi:MAG: M48 family metalloprotease [Candidatus Hydrogenedentes bacterium]|nr:M48 family metalloprotease [Candidatus Hydrogenedentota bacterium]
MPRKKNFRHLGAIFASILCLGLLSAGCATVDGQQPNMMSLEQEKQLGRQHAEELKKQFKESPDAELQAYVDRVGSRLAAVSPRQDLDYDFTVLEDPGFVNAAATGGGYMFVWTGLLGLCENEAELAGVMAHELGHVISRHIGEQYTRAQVASIVLGVVQAASNSQAAQQAAEMGAGLAMLSFSRQQELESDRIAVDMMLHAGYKPEALITLFQKLGATEGASGGPPAILRTHPATSRRVQELEAIIAQYPLNTRQNSELFAERYQQSVLPRLPEEAKQH